MHACLEFFLATLYRTISGDRKMVSRSSSVHAYVLVYMHTRKQQFVNKINTVSRLSTVCMYEGYFRSSYNVFLCVQIRGLSLQT